MMMMMMMMMISISTSCKVLIIILSSISVLHTAHGFAPAIGRAVTATSSAWRSATSSSPSTIAAANSLVVTTTTTTISSRRHRRRRRSIPSSSSSSVLLFSNSREQVEQFLSESYPKFCSLLYQDPNALQQMRESELGFAVFAVSDAAFYNALTPEQLQLLEAACCNEEPQLQQIVSTMAAYHMVSVPITAENMASFRVVTTRVGELPVEVVPSVSDGSGGALYVNGVRIIQSYVFEDVIIQNYQDKNGNMLGSQTGQGGKRYIVHEMENLICPNELWQSLHFHFHSAGV